MSELMKKEFGARVRVLREQAGLSTGRFAMMIGLSKSFVIQIEHGQRNVSLDTIERIAAGFSMTVSELFEDIDMHGGGALDRKGS